MPTQALKAGRPFTVAGGMRRCSVMLDAGTIARARELGAGNLSLGLRMALAPIVQLGAEVLQVSASLDREPDEVPAAATSPAPEPALD